MRGRQIMAALLCLALLALAGPAAGAEETARVTFSTSPRQVLGETDATLACIVETPGGDINSVVQVGVEISRNGQTIAAKLDNATPWGDYIEVYYPLNSALNCTLEPGTTYQYRFYAVMDGTLYSSEQMSFTTTGGATAVITFDAAGGSVFPERKTVVRTGTYGELPVPVREGYAFQGWNRSADGTQGTVDPNDPVDPREDHTLYAQWLAQSYLVILDAAGGTADRGIHVVRCGESYGAAGSLPVPTRAGYVFLGWYTAASGGTLVTDETQVTAPTSHTLYAQWEPEVKPAGTDNFTAVNVYHNGLFWDVNANDPAHWFAPNVAAAYELGLMRGTGSETFAPKDNVTLAEAVTMAARIHSIYHTGSDRIRLYDGGEWYDAYVDYAREHNLISVTARYDFGKDATREEFVHILAHALPPSALEPIQGVPDFADEHLVRYGADVDLLCRAGVIRGTPEPEGLCFKPLDPIIRGEAAAVITRMARPELRRQS